MSETQGKRIPDSEDNVPVNQGDYGKVGGVWWAKVPAPGFPAASLADHEVVEHAD